MGFNKIKHIINDPHAPIAFEKIHFFRGVFAFYLVLSEKVLYNDCIGAENTAQKTLRGIIFMVTISNSEIQVVIAKKGA